MEDQKDWSEDDEVRLRKHNIELTNQEIVELAHITRDTVDYFVTSHEKLACEEASNYRTCYYLCRRLLKIVDPSYLDWHSKLKEFYREGWELSADWDRLAWMSTEEYQRLMDSLKRPDPVGVA